MAGPRSFFEKVWDDHVIAAMGDGVHLLGIDRIIWHEHIARIAARLDQSGRSPARPDLVFTTFDHTVATIPGRTVADAKTPHGVELMAKAQAAAQRFGFHFFGLDDPRQGITHVIATETGAALPGLTVVCGDSHTCTLGGIGALGWGIGNNDGEHALATQTLYQVKPKAMRIAFAGKLPVGVYAKDLIMHLIAGIGAQGGIGYAVEFAGDTIRAMPVEGRLTLCNMAVEFSAAYGFVAPDDTTYAYLAGRDFAPKGAGWDDALAHWRSLPSDAEARFDKEVGIACDALKPQVSWGTSPQQVGAIDTVVPDPASEPDAALRGMAERALSYMDLKPGTPLGSIPLDLAYIGSCTNARLSDLREAARILRGRKVAEGVRAICVPGSTAIRDAAKAEGLDAVFRAAGFAWHEAGCGMCNAMGIPGFAGLRTISTTNRSFENRQGTGARTHIASPATVAASAIAGRIADPRPLLA